MHNIYSSVSMHLGHKYFLIFIVTIAVLPSIISAISIFTVHGNKIAFCHASDCNSFAINGNNNCENGLDL